MKRYSLACKAWPSFSRAWLRSESTELGSLIIAVTSFDSSGLGNEQARGEQARGPMMGGRRHEVDQTCQLGTGAQPGQLGFEGSAFSIEFAVCTGQHPRLG
ncbi:hypothetical protein D3C84_1123060 [compost metagenome]